ncbi:MAG TPA: hypothetical protein VGB79_04980 [Allosphingosinicella sp.]
MNALAARLWIRLLCGLGMAFASFWVPPAWASDGVVRIAMVRTGETVDVTYTLPAPVTSLALRLSEGPQPAARIEVREDGLRLNRGRIEGIQPFTRITLRVTSDSTERDGVYPLARRLGSGGFVVYAPYLLPKERQARVTIGTTGRPRRLTVRASDGYVLVGASPERRDGFAFLAANDIAPSLAEEVKGRTSRLLAYYRSKLRRRPDVEPTIVLARYDLLPGMSRGLLRGDVSANGVVFLRTYVDVRAPSAEGPPPAQHARFLAHELFHLWNRSRDPARENAWLMEGGAEYAGWVATASLWPIEHRLKQSAGGALRTCMMYLGARPLSGLEEMQARSVRYPCGAVVHWAVDVAARAQGTGLDGFAIWRRLLAHRDRTGSYTLADYRAAVAELAPAAAPRVESLVGAGGIERWAALATALNGMGAEVRVSPPSEFVLRLAAAKALVLSACREVHGVGENGGRLVVQAQDSCREFGDDPAIEEAGGVSVLEAAAFYEAVRSRCEINGSINVVVNGERGRRAHRVRCDTAVEPPPPELTVVRA